MKKTVAELRKALDGLDGEMEVILRITTDGGDTLHMMNIEDVSVEQGCTDTEALMIYGYAEEDPEGAADVRPTRDGSNACQCGCRCTCKGPHRGSNPSCPLR